MFKYYELVKDVLAVKRLDNGMLRIVKIKKGERYKYYDEFNYGNKVVYLCKSIKDENIMVNVIKIPFDDFNKYFKRVKFSSFIDTFKESE